MTAEPPQDAFESAQTMQEIGLKLLKSVGCPEGAATDEMIAKAVELNDQVVADAGRPRPLALTQSFACDWASTAMVHRPADAVAPFMSPNDHGAPARIVNESVVGHNDNTLTIPHPATAQGDRLRGLRAQHLHDKGVASDRLQLAGVRLVVFGWWQHAEIGSGR